jgi:3-phenylpropionate/cinnamic acid dioxygenase small subunit
MTLSLQEISDRMEIQDMLYEYADIIDKKDFDRLRDVFAEDSHIDYSAYGGAVGNREEAIEFLKQAMVDVFPNTQHLNANIQIKVEGDAATGRVMCFNPMEMNMPDGGTQVIMFGLWYIDKYIRTEQGWRIKERAEEKSWSFNTPEFMNL